MKYLWSTSSVPRLALGRVDFCGLGSCQSVDDPRETARNLNPFSYILRMHIIEVLTRM